jgi:hypothetical protein
VNEQLGGMPSKTTAGVNHNNTKTSFHSHATEQKKRLFEEFLHGGAHFQFDIGSMFQSVKAEPVHANLLCTLEELYNGSLRNMKLTR